MVVSSRLIIYEIYCRDNINLAIGFVVGHEITHGIDRLRQLFDKNGDQHTFWSQHVEDIYEQRSKCIIEQYNNYIIRHLSLQVCYFFQSLRKIYADFFR